MSASSALVWFKRDLRQQDHAALAAAQTFEASAGVFIIEPDWLGSAECSAIHVDFTLACLRQLRAALSQRGLPLIVRVGPAVEVLEALRGALAFTHLLSHEETGPGWSFRRDLEVAAWCRSRSVVWQEFTQTGVIRGLRSRNGWAARWNQRMAAAPVEAAVGVPGPVSADASTGGFAGFSGQPHVALGNLPTLASLGLAPHGKQLQVPGERAAWATLHSFLDGRGRHYRRTLPSPLTAPEGCSRLSPHLAFGTLSMRSVHQASEACIRSTDDRGLAHALRGFTGRLRWHCHFMQKLESEPAIEFRNFARVCDGLRETQFDTTKFAAWCNAQTGYPMVDACMRSLQATGWLNFRMRAMLVSFASYHLWLHWREPGLFLARQFLDFEPGIHWSQMQMQSGTTGINTLRIYSPTKQAHDQDPQGVFIRQWLPELGRVPLALLAQPWQMDAAQQLAAGCVIGRDYPAPIVDDKRAIQYAKDQLYGLRKTSDARQQAHAVQERHGSRKSALPNSAARQSAVRLSAAHNCAIQGQSAPPQRASKAAAKAADRAAAAALQGSLF